MDIQAEFERIQSETGNHELMTGFKLKGEYYGGAHPYDYDPRVRDFLGWTPKVALRKVLELASCEGGQTYEICKNDNVMEVRGYDGKEWLVERARKIQGLLMNFDYKISKATFDVCDVDTFDPTMFKEKFGSCFCSGLLYHLQQPWKLIRDLRGVCDYMYIATHFTPPNIVNGDQTADNGKVYEGRVVNEPKSNMAWSAICDVAFWFTLPSLIRCMMDYGWHPVLMRCWNSWSGVDPNPMVGILCE